MRIAVPRETDAGEPRVAATPETIKKLKSFGAEVAVARGAGIASGIPDAEFEAAGAQIADAVTKDADIVLKVRRPAPSELAAYKKGALVIAVMDPYGNEAALKQMADAGVAAFAMELMPRITRAQSMDVLSSQANLAGYRAVIDAAEEYGRALPMMMTAAGTVPAAKVFIMGVGVAGLQAIATARRLGADRDSNRRAARDQGAGGKPGRQVSRGRRRGIQERADRRRLRQGNVEGISGQAGRADRRAYQEAGHRHHDRADPGPSGAAAHHKRDGGFDAAGFGDRRSCGRARRQCRRRQAGEVAQVGGVKIVGHLNVAGRLAASASALYAKNLLTFVETLIDKKEKKLAVNWDDELVKATLLTRDGAVVHPNFQPKTAA